MSKKFYAIIALLMLVSFTMTVPVNAMVQRVCPPRFDQITAKIESDPDLAWLMFLAGELDVIPDVIRFDHITEAQAEGHETKSMPGYHVCYLGINNRDYVPSDAAQPDAGRPLAPLNYSCFRQALANGTLNMAQKAANITDIYGPGVVKEAYTVIPEALGVWHNPTVGKPGYQYAAANETLHDGGFYIVGDKLYQPNGVVVRDSIAVISPASAPTSVEFTLRFCLGWQEFFQGYLGVTNCVMTHTPTDTGALQVSAFQYRNFDVYMLCWGLSRFPDYLYDFFHSSQDGAWYYNSCGVDDAELDDLIETIKWGLVYEDKLDAAWRAQEILVNELVPYVCMYHRIYWNIFRENWPGGQGPGYQQQLLNIVNQDGFGADNTWTWLLMHWNTTDGENPSLTGGTVNYNLQLAPENLHPGWATWAYEWWTLGLCLDGLIAAAPDLQDMAWIGCDWTVESFEWPALGITEGTKVTFRIRDNVYWHDGYPVTVEDIQFAWEFMANFPRYLSVYQYYLWSEIEDPNTISVYLDITSQYILYDYAGVALYWPKHIYNPDWHPVIDTVTADPGFTPYATWMADYTGPTPAEMGPSCDPPTALVGCGPYYFFEYNAEAETEVLKKNPNYWPCSPVCCCLDVPGRITNDTDHAFEVVICNQGAKEVSEVQHVDTPVHISHFEVYIDDPEQLDPVYIGAVGAPIDAFRCEEYGIPGYVLNLPCGAHVVCIKVYETGDADNPIAHCCKTIIVTAREDLNYDIYVGIDDIVRCAEAFGAAPPPNPGWERWDSRADLNDDWYCGIDDIVDIAEDFGKC